MLAAAGFLVQVRHSDSPATPPFPTRPSHACSQEKFHPLFDGVGGPAIYQIPRLPSWVWLFMTTGIAFTEAVRIQKGWASPNDSIEALKPDYYPGDLDWDPLGIEPDNPDEFRKMQERELSNGRLAMLAAAGFLAQETVTGTTWSESSNLLRVLGINY